MADVRNGDFQGQMFGGANVGRGEGKCSTFTTTCVRLTTVGRFFHSSIISGRRQLIWTMPLRQVLLLGRHRAKGRGTERRLRCARRYRSSLSRNMRRRLLALLRVRDFGGRGCVGNVGVR